MATAVYTSFDSAIQTDPPGQVIVTTRVMIVPDQPTADGLRNVTTQAETTVAVAATPNQIASAVRTSVIAACAAVGYTVVANDIVTASTYTRG